MVPDTFLFRRDYLLRLPLPLAQLYGRAHNAKSARERHDNAFYLFEAVVKLGAATATAYYLEEVALGRTPRVPLIDRQLAQLALPSLGQWLAIWRELARYFHARVDAATHPWGQLWDQLGTPRKDSPALLALYRRLKHGPDGELAGDATCSLYQVFESLVQYRNGVFGHGAARFESFYTEQMGPLLFPATNEMLADGMLPVLGPPHARLVQLVELRQLDTGQFELGWRELVGAQSARLAPLELTATQAETLLPNRVALLWPGRTVPLRLDPLLQYRESDLSEEVLFLNRDRNGKQVEYLSYTTGRTERERSMLPALAALLSRVTDRAVEAADLERFAEQSLAETPSVERLFAPQLPTSAELGEYTLLSELGRGGMGVVYLARQSSLGRLVALKMLPHDLADDEVSLARFRREIRHLAACDDPHIVKVLASGTFPDGRLYYTMEYVPGSDLEMVWRELAGASDGTSTLGSSTLLGTTTWTAAILSASRRQRERAESSRSRAQAGPGTAPLPNAPSSLEPLPLPPLPELPSVQHDAGGYVRHIVMLARDVARALQSMHDQGIVHRDVKPANLVLTPDGSRVVLMDFGLAKGQSHALAASLQGGLLGTLRYAAPEQLAAANLKVGPAADVRGLGVTLWELLTRQRLFGTAEDEARLTQEVLTSDVPRLRSVDHRFDRDLDAIVAHATARRLSDRIASAGQLADLLQLWLDGKPIPIRMPTMPELAWRWLREHAVAASVVTLLLAMTLTTGMVMWRSRLQRQQQSQEVWQQVSQQSQHLLQEALPEVATALQHPDVNLAELEAVLPTLQQQFAIVQQLATSQGLDADTRQRAQAQAQAVAEGMAQFERRRQGVAQLLHARVLRFQLSEEAFRLADGMPVIQGRDALPVYRQVLSDLAGIDVLDAQHPPSHVAQTLQPLAITEHLRMALDDWLVLSYGQDEQPIRERLVALADEIDQGEGRTVRGKLRRALLAHDVNTLETLAQELLAARSLTPDQYTTGLLLVDGLLEQLRLREALAVLRRLRDQGTEADLSISRFRHFWVNFLLGVVLNQIGSREQLYEALQCFQAAAALDPARDVVRLNRAQTELLLGRPEQAQQWLATVHETSLQPARQFQQGVVLALSGQCQSARQLAQQIVAADPNSVLAHHRAAGIWNELLDLDAAQATAQAGLRFDAQHPALIWLAHGSDRAARQMALAQVPPARLQRFWLVQCADQRDALQKGMKEQDLPRVELAREELQQLGYQDWQLSWQEYTALFSSQNWNGDSWEGPLRQLANEAPPLLAEQVPTTLLGILFSLPDLMAQSSAQQLLLREVELHSGIYPPSAYRRLLASANLLQYAAPELASQFYQAARGKIPELRAAGYASEAAWSAIDEMLEKSVHRTTNPDSLSDGTAEGQRSRADSYWQFGQARLQSRDYAQARQYFEKYLAISEQLVRAEPNDLKHLADLSYAQAWLSNVAFSEGNYELAYHHAQLDLTNSEAMVRLAPHDPAMQRHLARAVHMLVRIEEGRGNSAAARTQLTRAMNIFLQLTSDNPADGVSQLNLLQCYQWLGRMYLQTQDYAQAETYLAKLLPLAEQRFTSAPHNLVAQRELAHAHTELGKAALLQSKLPDALQHFQQAQTLLESLMVKMRDHPQALAATEEIYFYLAQTHELRRDFAAAQAAYDRDVELRRRYHALQPSDTARVTLLARSLGYRGAFLRRRGHAAPSASDLDQALQLAPQLPELWHERGQLRYQIDQVDAALADYDRAVALDSKQPEYLSARAEALAWQERYAESIRDLDLAIQMAPQTALYWFQRGKTLYAMDQVDRAIADFTEAIRLNPQRGEFYRKRAEAWAWQQQYKAAWSDLTQLDQLPNASVHHQDPSYWLLRTDAAFHLDHPQDATHALERVVELASQDANMLNLAGVWQLRLGAADRAQELFSQAIAQVPTHPSAHRHLALTLAAQQQWDAAMQAYEQCLAQGLTFPTSWSEAALICKRQGNAARYSEVLNDIQRRYAEGGHNTERDAIVWTLVRFAGPTEDNAWQNVITGLHREAGPTTDPSTSITDRTRAALQLRQGQSSQAESLLTTWLTQPDHAHDARAYILLAMALAHQDKLPEAKSALTSARSALAQFDQQGNRYTSADGKIKWVTQEETAILLQEVASQFNLHVP